MKNVSCSRMPLLVGVIASLLLARQAAKGDFVFGEPIKVPNINSSSDDSSPSISRDGLMLYFNSNRDHGSDLCYTDIWVATRTTKDEPWGTPTRIGPPINTPGPEGNCCISADGLELYFAELWPPLFLPCGCQPRSEGYGYGDIWVSSRETTEDPWGEPVNLGPAVNSSAYEDTPNISADGLTLYFSRAPETSFAGGGLKLYVTTRLSKDDPWSPVVELGPPVNTVAPFVSFPFITSDGLSLLFMGAPLDNVARGDIFVSRRATVTDPWGKPVCLPSVNTALNEECVTFAAGDSILYFSRGDPYNPNRIPDPALATSDIWQVEVTPIVDLNGDSIVDAADFGRLIDSWHTNDPLCDIAPPPMGDGFVDVQDLIALAEHLPPSLECVAHWTLDEARGTMAYDSAGSGDATVMGNATWRPGDGKIGGALQFDGVDDYVSTDFVADPKTGPVRVVAWIKSDVAGGAIISQTPGTGFGSTWLGTDPSDGTLMTAMMFPFPALHSTVVAVDGQWHEVAVEWDGTYRHLWSDTQEVSRDTVPMSMPPLHWDGTPNLGAGDSLQPGSFFSGLIDDVRIYKSAVKP